MGPKADTDLMIDIFHYFKKNWNKIMVKSILGSNRSSCTRFSREQALLYYMTTKEKKNYKADYLMIDLEPGTKTKYNYGGKD